RRCEPMRRSSPTWTICAGAARPMPSPPGRNGSAMRDCWRELNLYLLRNQIFRTKYEIQNQRRKQPSVMSITAPLIVTGASSASQRIVSATSSGAPTRRAGALPIGFDIPAVTLEEAADKFGQLAREAIERTVKELQEMRRQAASQIVVPQGPLPPLGGAGGGGKIQMP